VQYLEDSFLVTKLDRVDINALSLKRATQFKLYLTNPSLRASMFQTVRNSEDQNFGYVIETAVAAQLGIGEERQNWRYANWRVSKKQGELDFVKIDAGIQKPVEAFEVKWSDGPFDHPGELKEAVMFAQSNGLNKIVVTSKTEKGAKYMDNVELSFIPTALFAYKIGKESFSK
jgi:predicted AAA+ superfamily ATPase